jgi:hypothetical protein
MDTQIEPKKLCFLPKCEYFSHVQSIWATPDSLSQRPIAHIGYMRLLALGGIVGVTRRVFYLVFMQRLVMGIVYLTPVWFLASTEDSLIVAQSDG